MTATLAEQRRRMLEAAELPAVRRASVESVILAPADPPLAALIQAARQIPVELAERKIPAA